MIRQSKKQRPTAPTKLSTQEQPTELTFLEHLYEVRKRLFWVVSVLVAASAIGFQLKDPITAAIMQPLHGQKLVYLTPGGGFSFIFTVSLYFGVLFMIPVVVYQIFRFLQPIIGKTSRKFVAGFLVVSTLLAAAGASFGYFVTIPAALGFLATFAGDSVTPTLTADSYLSFVVTYILGLAAIFQVPLLLFITDHVRPLKPGFLSSTQNYVIIGSTVIAALITPTPDAFNMAVVAIPIIFVYEVGTFVIYVRRKGRNRKGARRNALDLSLVKLPEEPLTDIINELKQPSVVYSINKPSASTMLDIQIIASIDDAIVETSSRQEIQTATIATSRPQVRLASEMVAQQQNHKQHQVMKAIDGFSPRTNKVPGHVVVPRRQVARSAEAVRTSTPTARPLRSLDGFSFG